MCRVGKKKEKRSMENDGGAHVLIFHCPAQGHVGSMLKLAELLALHHLHVTFLNNHYIHNRLTRFGDIQALSASYPTLHLKTISDCYDEGEHPGFGDRAGEVIVSITLHAKPLLRDILVSERPGIPRVSCIIQDGIFGSLAADLAAELRIPYIHFRTISACCFWAYFCVPKLIQCKELPIRGMDSQLHSSFSLYLYIYIILIPFLNVDIPFSVDIYIRNSIVPSKI
ncbi:7-deoxyloganetic acid glucosyltransferase [Spatholobus suberectus]|nr:7-deoxyloganetic acid glucosyltransferase [Spatholobus suberectus]